MTSVNADRRTLQKVRRNSLLRGCEADLWRPTSKRAMRLALKAAEKFDRTHKAKGRRNGPLGHVALEIHRAMWACIDFRTGRLEPSIDWLMASCRRSRCAVVNALRRLKAAGFLTWVRRLEWTGGPPGVRGPQVRQISNAYQLATPTAALALVGNLIVPADEITRLSEVAAFVSSCQAQASADSSLGKLLARWANAFVTNASPPGGRNPAPSVFSKRGGR